MIGSLGGFRGQARMAIEERKVWIKKFLPGVFSGLIWLTSQGYFYIIS
jgi:hypothetical protein